MNTTNQEVKEQGAASIKIELDEGFITVYHGEDSVSLASWFANKGDWEKLWERIMELKNKE